MAVLRCGALVALVLLAVLVRAGVSSGQCDSRDCGGGGGGAGSGAIHLTWTPTSLDFGAVPVGTQTPAASITFTNGTDGGVASFNGVSLIGTNANDFAITSNTCTGTLGAGQSCTVQVS